VGRRVREVIRDGVGVLYPILFASAYDGIGIMVEAQKRRDLLHPLLNAPPELNSTLGFEVRCKQDIHVRLGPRE